jgi:hypothetical protein
MESKFNIENPAELIGRLVLYKGRYSRRISTIESVTKKHFKLKGDTSNYRLADGCEVVGTGRQNWGTGGTCYLITADEAIAFRKEFEEIKEKNKWAIKIPVLIKSASHEQLKSIIEILEPSK